MLFRSPLIRVVCAALIVASLVIAPTLEAGAAGESAKLERIKAELAAIKKRIAAAKGEANAIRTEVASLDAKIRELNRQIRTGETQIAELESGIRSAEIRILELEDERQQAIKASNARARSMYKAGPATFLTRFLSVRSVGELTRLAVWWQVASELDGKAMIVAARLKADLDDQRSELLHIRSDLSAQKAWLGERKALIEGARAEKAAALKQVEANIAHSEAHIRDLEKESRALTAAIQSAGSRSTGSVSSSGFIWPLRGRVTSEYGRRGGGFHTGIDIDGNTGDPIVASKAGTILGVSCGSGYGICTVIDHGGGVATLYAHMSRKAVSSGSVRQGQVIGYVGCTGSCSGDHLHFEVRVNGEPQNPRRFLP